MMNSLGELIRVVGPRDCPKSLRSRFLGIAPIPPGPDTSAQGLLTPQVDATFNRMVLNLAQLLVAEVDLVQGSNVLL